MIADDRPVLAKYGESRRNPTNKAAHWVCVPVIVRTVVALLSALPVLAALAAVSPGSTGRR